MFEAPKIMQMAQELARHSGIRQAVISANIANADTPGFRAKDVRSFSDVLAHSDATIAMRRTRNSHIGAGSHGNGVGVIDAGGRASPNGNTVSLEDELVRATQAQSAHNLALTVYKHSLDVMRTALGRGR